MLGVEEKSLLKLHSANVFQLTHEGKKRDWQIRENVTDKVLTEMPNKLSDSEMFAIMDFIKQVELEAFNVGIRFQKYKQNALLKEEIDGLREILRDLKTENERLVSILETYVPSEE